jgi:ABC-type amino acid transport substrate-binding protein
MQIRMVGIVAALIGLVATTCAAKADSALDRIKKDGVLKVCYSQILPEVYKDPKTGEWTGVFVDLVNELGKWMKVKVQPIEVGWDVAVLSLKQGTCDIFASSLIYNAPRAMEINYVRPFLSKGINVVIQKANPKNLKNPLDLNNPAVTVVAQLGSREQETVQRLYPKAKILAVRANSQLEIIEQVKRGDADAAAMPAITIKWWLQIPENAAWGAEGFPGQDFGNAPASWGVRYADRDLKDFLDSYVGWVIANKVAVNLYDEYMTRTNPFGGAR